MPTRKVVLIVDDNPKNMKLFHDLLQVRGHTTLEATNGQRGVKLAREEKPDLILMDFRMPVMDGIEAAKILKSEEATHGIPILMLTASVTNGDRERILETGCDDYMAKPVEIPLFLEKIDLYLG